MVAAYLSELTARLEALLRDRLVAAWLVGSGALGDFDPVSSDVDVQAVASTGLARRDLERLVRAISHEALPCPVRGLEFVLYAREDLDDPRGPAFQLNLNSGRAMDHHAGYDPDAEPRFWFVLDVAIAREHARRLAGLPPAAVLPALPRPLVLAALRESLSWYGAHAADEQAVLAACRAWAWADGGRWLSKGDAATWAMARGADPEPIAKALARRADPGAAGPTRHGAAALLDAVARRLGSPGPPP